ncbi:unnamed protein product [Boreogadus saida]
MPQGPEAAAGTHYTTEPIGCQEASARGTGTRHRLLLHPAPAKAGVAQTNSIQQEEEPGGGTVSPARPHQRFSPTSRPSLPPFRRPPSYAHPG